MKIYNPQLKHIGTDVYYLVYEVKKNDKTIKCATDNQIVYDCTEEEVFKKLVKDVEEGNI